MKGGKAGRKRRPSGGAGAAPAGRRAPKKGSVVRPANAAPKKGSRKKSFGAISSAEEERGG